MLGGALGGLYLDQGGRRDRKVYSFEKDPLCAAIRSGFVELAGLKGVVDVIVGEAAVEMGRPKREGSSAGVDFLLLDHWQKS